MMSTRSSSRKRKLADSASAVAGSTTSASADSGVAPSTVGSVARSAALPSRRHSSSTASSSSSSSSKSSKSVLVLGMANVSPTFLASMQVRPDTTISVARDRIRLARLEERFKYNIISMNDKQSEEDCLPNKHYMGPFSSRSASGLQAKFGQVETLHLHAVLLDYFRFPPGYIQVAYREFCPMLFSLISNGLVTTESRGGVFVPNFQELRERIYMMFIRREAKVLTQPEYNAKGERKDVRVYLHFQGLDEYKHPLYLATDDIWKTVAGAVQDKSKLAKMRQSRDIAGSLGGFIHKDEIVQFRNDGSSQPFVRITVTTDPIEAKRSFRRTFDQEEEQQHQHQQQQQQQRREHDKHSTTATTRTRKKQCIRR